MNDRLSPTSTMLTLLALTLVALVMAVQLCKAKWPPLSPAEFDGSYVQDSLPLSRRI